MTNDGTPDNESGLANARRLVACWNALLGVDVDFIERVPQSPGFTITQLLTRERDELIEALRDTFALIESGYLVRDTSHDHEAGWAEKQLDPMRKLGAAAKVLAKYPVKP